MTGDATGLTAKVRMLRESTYNVAPSGNFYDIPFLASTKLGTLQPLTENPVIGQGRDPLQPLRAAISGGGDLVVPIDARNFGLHLAGLLGNPVTTHPSGHYQHLFTSGAITPISRSIEVAHPNVSEYFMNSGLFYEQLDLSFSPAGMPTAKFTLVGTSETPAGTSGAGTPVNINPSSGDDVYFSNLTMGISLGGTPLANILKGSLTFKNNLVAQKVVANNGYIGGVVPGQTALTGKITARFNDDVLLGDATNGTPVALVFSYTNSADQKLSFSAPLVMLPKPQITIPGPGGISVDFDFQGYSSPNTPTALMTATLLNDLDGTAYAAG